MRVLCIGHATYDIMISMDSYPIENSKNRVKRLLGCGGGQASNAAYLLGKWGIDTYFLGLVGKDEYGKIIKNELNNVGVNTDYLEENGKTTISYIVVNSINGTRTPLTYHPTDYKMKFIDEDINPDIILTDGYEYDMVNKLLDKYPNCISVLDAEKNNDDVINLAKRVTYVVASKSFLEKFSNIKIDNDDKFDEAIKIANKHFNNLIVTLEDKGCNYNGKIIPSIKVKAIDSTGAGDIFHGAFVYGLACCWDIEKILKFSNIAGALSVTRLGSRNSVFSLKEVEDKYYEFK